MHDATNVVGIVMHAEPGLDGVGEARGGPAIAIESSSARSGLVDFGHTFELFGIEAAGTARRAAFAEAIKAFTVQRTIPAGCCRTADAELPGDMGLRESPLQVLCG